MELIIVMALLAILTTLGVPSLLSYMQTSVLSAGTDEFASLLNRARALAIVQNTNVCVQVTGSNVRLLTGGCTGTIWTGIGTSSAGIIALSNRVQVSGGTAAIFTNVGGAAPGASYTLTDSASGRTRNVSVGATGRITIQ